MSRVTLVLGGARSGKSRYAEGLSASSAHKTYIATAEAFDDEMRQRIAQHRAQRGGGWTTIETPYDIARSISDATGFVLVDCITVWLGNLMHREIDASSEVGKLIEALASTRARVVLVSNEVGLSLVPETTLGRRFRDLQGVTNQRLAAVADEVVFVAAGLPLTLKSPAR